MKATRSRSYKHTYFSLKFVKGSTKAFVNRKQLAYQESLDGKANSSHNHSASNITSGTLGVARGGTGRSTLTSGYFLRGNGTGAVTMSSVAQVKSALGIDNGSGSGLTQIASFEYDVTVGAGGTKFDHLTSYSSTSIQNNLLKSAALFGVAELYVSQCDMCTAVIRLGDIPFLAFSIRQKYVETVTNFTYRVVLPLKSSIEVRTDNQYQYPDIILYSPGAEGNVKFSLISNNNVLYTNFDCSGADINGIFTARVKIYGIIV